MRSNTILGSILLIGQVSAQITLEHTFDSVSYGRDFYITDIGNNNSKFVFIDATANSFDLLNLDGTPYLTDIPTPDPIEPDYTVAYVTNALFDCDSSTLEYAFMSYLNGYLPFRVLRTDGTILLQVDSARGPVCYGCVAGTKEITPIVNTQEGAKLVLFKDLSPGVRRNLIYDLCGTLPASDQTVDIRGSGVMVKVYPNPSSTMIIFEINSLTNLTDSRLTVVDATGQLVLSQIVLGQNDLISIEVSHLTSGQYQYSVGGSQGTLQSGKFIVTK